MTILDDLSGLEFEALMVDVFRNYGYQNVQQTPKTGDEGRDILMMETVNGQQRGVVVECKHMDQVGREIVQKLHSAVITYTDYESNRGMVVTTGTFTSQAQDYIQKLGTNGDGTQIELIDGSKLKAIADDVGLDLRNGKIELICKQTLPPVDSHSDVETPVMEQFQAIANITASDIDTIESAARFRPMVTIDTRTDAVFETSVGVIHRVNERDDFLVHGDSTPPQFVDDSTRQLITDNAPLPVDLAVWKETDAFADTTVERFSHAESEIEAWAIDHLQSKYATTVEYTGDNNVDYEKECVPSNSDISIASLTSMYVPRIRSQTRLKEYTYLFEYDSAGSNRHVIENGIARCVHCGWSWTTLTYCDNCGSVNCWRHTRTERVEGTPICTDCAVTERFGLRKRYFYNENNRNTFREEYDEMSTQKKILEHKPFIVISVIVLVTLLVYII